MSKLAARQGRIGTPIPARRVLTSRCPAQERPTPFSCRTAFIRLCLVIIVFGEVFSAKVSYRCFDGVASDLMARRDAMESLSLAFEGRECQL